MTSGIANTREITLTAKKLTNTLSILYREILHQIIFFSVEARETEE